MKAINADMAMQQTWTGRIVVTCDAPHGPVLRAALELLVHAHAHGLMGPGRLAWSTEGEGASSAGWTIQASAVHGSVWLLLSNLLAAQDANAMRSALRLAGEETSAVLPIEPRLYAVALPSPLMECDLSELTDVLREFVLQFEFSRALVANERDAFCAALDAWAALVDAGAFPMQESLEHGSVIAGYSGRFEDPATAGVYADGLAANPLCFGLPVQLANRWCAQVGVRRMALEHMS